MKLCLFRTPADIYGGICGENGELRGGMCSTGSLGVPCPNSVVCMGASESTSNDEVIKMSFPSPTESHIHDI